MAAALKVAVNISPVQFRDARLATNIIKLLTETGFPAKRLEIEITENSFSKTAPKSSRSSRA